LSAAKHAGFLQAAPKHLVVCLITCTTLAEPLAGRPHLLRPVQLMH
jgi:hypothetical protein